MENHVATRHPGGQRGKIEVVPAQEAEIWVLLRLFQKPVLAGRKVVPAKNLVPIGKKPVAKVAPDETGRAGDECFMNQLMRYH